MISTANSLEKHDSLTVSNSMSLVRPKAWTGRIVLLLFFLLAITVLCLIFVPWQQSVNGTGQVFVYSANERPQNISAQIPGRIENWRVQEGDTVEAGAIIVELEDIEQRFLDPEQPRRLRERRDALLKQRAEAQNRLAALKQQYAALSKSRQAQVPSAGEAAEQTKEQYRQAQETVKATQQTLNIIRETTIPATIERLNQAKETLKREQQGVIAAEERRNAARIQRQRVADLFGKQLRSQRDNELAQQDLVVADTAVEQAKAAVEVASKGVSVAEYEVQRVQMQEKQAVNDLARVNAGSEFARRGTRVGDFAFSRVQNDTQAVLSGVQVNMASANETIATVTNSIIQLEVDLQNLERRTGQQTVRAPRDGQIVRLMKVGTGETVKAGDTLAVLAPDTDSQGVELFLTDNDAPLVRVGRKVRLQFAGYPALQFSGWPSAAVGTFAGEIAVIDALDDGSSNFRVIVRPDKTRIAKKLDQPWPPLKQLRPGAKVVGWVMLDEVSLGYELWRQFNAFPPTVEREVYKGLPKGRSDKADDYDEKEKEKSGIKRKAKYKL